MNNEFEKNDLDLKDRVFAELKYQSNAKARNITIFVKDRTVTLNGYVSNYAEKLEIVQAVKRVVGINGITDNIKIQQSYFYYLTEREIAATAIHQIDWATLSPPGTLRVAAHKGWLDLKAKWSGVKKVSQSASYGTYDVSKRYLTCSSR